jgi:hypothetical protein
MLCWIDATAPARLPSHDPVICADITEPPENVQPANVHYSAKPISHVHKSPKEHYTPPPFLSHNHTLNPRRRRHHNPQLLRLLLLSSLRFLDLDIDRLRLAAPFDIRLLVFECRIDPCIGSCEALHVPRRQCWSTEMRMMNGYGQGGHDPETEDVEGEEEGHDDGRC